MPAFSEELVARANAEFAAYEGQFANGGELRGRVGAYWTFLDRPDLDGGDDVAWSAAFISYMVHLAGAEDRFLYVDQHSYYFHRTINDRLEEQDAGFWGYRQGEIPIAAGDIIGMNRRTAPPIDYDWAAAHDDYFSHADIVVGVDPEGRIHTIGGNVGPTPGQVGRKIFSLQDGRLINEAAPAQEVFLVIRSRLP